MKKITYILPLVILLTACSNTPKQAPIEITKEYLASNAHKKQYTSLKNNDLNLWWQTWKDPALLEILRELNNFNDSNQKALQTLKTLQKKYHINTSSSKWLEFSSQNPKEYKPILQDKFWYETRTLLSTITAKMYVDYTICNMEKDYYNFYKNALKDIQLSTYEDIKENAKTELSDIENQMKKLSKQCDNLEKAIIYATGYFPKNFEQTIKKSEVQRLIYQNSPVFDFPKSIEANKLMGRADIALAIQNFDLLWLKNTGNLEPISIEGIISPFSSGKVLSDNVFAIGGIAVHFPNNLRIVEVENSQIMEFRKDILEKIQSSAFEISNHIHKSSILTNNSNNAKYKEQRTLDYIESIKGKGKDDKEFLQERIQLSKDTLYFYEQQRHKILSWLDLYMITGVGFNDDIFNQ